MFEDNLKLKNKLRTIFNKYDHIGIYQSKKINFDEYDPEIKRVLKIFTKSKNLDEFKIKIYNIFVYMFDKDLAGPKSRYNSLAKEVYDLLQKEI